MKKVILIAALATAACGGGEPRNPYPHSYVCGKHKVMAEFSGNVARIDLDGVPSTLQQVVSADGAKYSSKFSSIPKKEIIFWTKGMDYALLEFDGKTFECVKRQ